MKKDSFKDKTTDQLKANLKAIKAITGILMGVLALLITVSLYGLLTKEDNSTFFPLLAVGFSCCAILPMQFQSMNKIKQELKLRGEVDQ